ncbi:MAG: peptide chain release factor N(5)-glutamine methyltransferase [Gammaproteobacteria bacterium]|nr:peptide chain release factor N(5)-glutamine methyltransferase [Gammaproteobacteria bacterium]
MPASIQTLLQQAEQQLAAVSESARLDAEVLLADILEKNRSYFRAFGEQELTPAQLQQFQNVLTQRAEGHPVAHILGRREFWSLDLEVNQHTLIPRPDTELLIEFILQAFPQQQLKVADLGTGSGAIALALASENPQWQITATDQSAAALAVAQRNAARLGIANIVFKNGDWYQPLAASRFDLIISNPPYIAADDIHLTQGDVRFEPLTALASGNDGLDDIRLLIAQAKQHLQTNGWLILEHGYDQKTVIFELLQSAGFAHITQKDDYAGNARLSAASYA